MDKKYVLIIIIVVFINRLITEISTKITQYKFKSLISNYVFKLGIIIPFGKMVIHLPILIIGLYIITNILYKKSTYPLLFILSVKLNFN